MDIVILSIFSSHAIDIYAGVKRAELRKSFTSSNISLVFLYETSPTSAVTGGVLLSKAAKYPIHEAIVRAKELGVPEHRSMNYFAGRSEGWILEIGYSFKFKNHVTLSDLQKLNHYFRVPQVFSYLDRYEGLSQFLIERARVEIEKNLKLVSIRRDEYERFRELVMDTVGSSYDGIDEGFISEILIPDRSKGADFSSESKVVKVFSLQDLRIGFTVLTLKRHGSIKTGPTVFSPDFRGLGLGLVARRKIESYAIKAGYHSVYCTCPDSRPSVVAYLASSGMTICAILKSHLARNRNEYVLAKRVEPTLKIGNDKVIIAKKGTTQKLNDVRVEEFLLDGVSNAANSRLQIEDFLVRTSQMCYFKLEKEEIERVFNALNNNIKFGADPNTKSKRMYIGRARNGQIIGVALLTHKRSSMLKINWFSVLDNPVCALAVFKGIQVNIESRRYYMTISTSFPRTLLALVDTGFNFEGRLPDPFGAGDHICLGWNNELMR